MRVVSFCVLLIGLLPVVGCNSGSDSSASSPDSGEFDVLSPDIHDVALSEAVAADTPPHGGDSIVDMGMADSDGYSDSGDGDGDGGIQDLNDEDEVPVETCVAEGETFLADDDDASCCGTLAPVTYCEVMKAGDCDSDDCDCNWTWCVCSDTLHPGWDGGYPRYGPLAPPDCSWCALEVCTACGDGECGPGETSCNCPGDCGLPDYWACNFDDDYDGVPNTDDNCPLQPNPMQEDYDADGIGDACDGDIDADGLPNNDDCAPFGPGSEKVCPEPDDSCQVATCNPGTGACGVQDAPNGTLCPDPVDCTPAIGCDEGNPCFEFEGHCISGVCHWAPLNCDDSDPCTIDTCGPPTGCVNTPLDCGDSGDPCVEEICIGDLGCMSIPNYGGECGCAPESIPYLGPEDACCLGGESVLVSVWADCELVECEGDGCEPCVCAQTLRVCTPCGDGLCAYSENFCNCPDDCFPPWELCDPDNPNSYPGAPELCNGLDDDCDGETDEGYPDADMDGIANCVDPDDD